MAHNLPLGSTNNGADWCLKALHPSDPITEVRGIPDKSAVPSVLMNFQSTMTLSPAVAATGTWSFNAALLPNPIAFMHVSKTDSTGTTPVNMLNTQVDGLNAPNKYLSWAKFAQRWRLAYMSVTVYQDGPDLANQGTLAACQTPTEAAEFHFSWKDTGTSQTAAASRIFAWDQDDQPSFDTCQSMPNAYFGLSKHGCYAPMKLTRTCQQWTSVRDHGFQWSSLVNSTTAPVPTTPLIALPMAATKGNFPFVDIDGPGFNGVDTMYGYLVPRMCNDNWVRICARNLAVTTSYSFFVRAGYEIQVHPGTLMSPHQKLSPAYDKLALNAYYAIAREMKDAYPADYNDLGKIWDVISQIAKSVAPALAAIPGFGLPLSGAITGAAALGDMVRKAVATRAQRVSDKTVGSKASMADVELARKVRDAARRPESSSAPLSITVVKRAPRRGGPLQFSKK